MSLRNDIVSFWFWGYRGDWMIELQAPVPQATGSVVSIICVGTQKNCLHKLWEKLSKTLLCNHEAYS